nr:cystin-1 isoform X1 [Pelodiscus sinensis]|eukprot:XP_025040724.1 cystin-1 isoform X1 [Pelodiscus sinensis]
MGSGSSRRKRGCSPGAHRPAGGRGSSAPSGQGGEASGGPAPAPTKLPSSSLRRPGAEAEDSDWELLEAVLAECEEPDALLPTARGSAAPIQGPPPRGPAGDSWTGHGWDSRAAEAAAAAGSGAAGGDLRASLIRSTQDPENNTSTNVKDTPLCHSAGVQSEITRSPRCNPQYRMITLKKSSWRLLNESTAAKSQCCMIAADSGTCERGFCKPNNRAK